jgi:hypothetical protein
MPKEGVEPSPCCQDGILNPARLPVPPLRLIQTDATVLARGEIHVNLKFCPRDPEKFLMTPASTADNDNVAEGIDVIGD